MRAESAGFLQNKEKTYNEKSSSRNELQLISLHNIKSKAADYKLEQQQRAKLKTSKRTFEQKRKGQTNKVTV